MTCATGVNSAGNDHKGLVTNSRKENKAVSQSAIQEVNVALKRHLGQGRKKASEASDSETLPAK